jgi:L-threonylcarbamoyladenylate synthase
VSEEVARAVDALRRGGLVAFPTETVYGLGADASNVSAVRRLYAVKGRPSDHPVIVHVGDTAELDSIGRDIPPIARGLATAFWPGPLTLVVQRRLDAVVDDVTGGRATVAVRVPDHPLALALLREFNGAVAAPSANRFGKVSPTTAAHVHDDLGADVDVVLDGGPCRVGVESTIVDVTGAAPVLLRLGGVPERALAQVAGAALAHRTTGEVAAPGTLPSHYAPRARLVLSAAAEADARAAELRSQGHHVALLTAPANNEEYARVLYARLRDADATGADVIVAVEPDDDGGFGATVRDRLERAARG